MTCLPCRNAALILLTATVGLRLAGAAQSPPADGPARVIVGATVTDKDGRFVDDLTPGDFVLLDNGKPQRPLAVRPDQRPLALVVMLDRSGSFTLIADRVDRIAQQAIDRLAPADHAQVLLFADSIRMDPAVLTSDHTALTAPLRQHTMGNGTRLWDAVDTAAAALDSADGRRTVLIVSDGEDTRSHLQQKDAIQRCQDRGISVHALGVWTQLLGATHAPSPELKRLTGDTGGAYFPLRPADDPAPIVNRAIDGMRHGYALEFSPAARDGKRHQIQVRVNRPGLTVRWRQTYLAPR